MDATKKHDSTCTKIQRCIGLAVPALCGAATFAYLDQWGTSASLGVFAVLCVVDSFRAAEATNEVVPVVAFTNEDAIDIKDLNQFSSSVNQSSPSFPVVQSQNVNSAKQVYNKETLYALRCQATTLPTGVIIDPGMRKCLDEDMSTSDDDSSSDMDNFSEADREYGRVVAMKAGGFGFIRSIRRQQDTFFHVSALQCDSELHIGARVSFFVVNNDITGRENCVSIQRASKDDFATALAIFSTEAPLSISLPESLPMNHLSTPFKETPLKKKRSRPFKNNNTYISVVMMDEGIKTIIRIYLSL